MNKQICVVLTVIMICCRFSDATRVQYESDCNPIPKKNFVLGITFGAGCVLATAGAVLFWTAQPDLSVAGADFDYGLSKILAPVVTAEAVVFGVISVTSFVRYRKLTNACRKVSLGIGPAGATLAVEF